MDKPTNPIYPNPIKASFPQNFNYYDILLDMPYINQYDMLNYSQIKHPFAQKVPLKTLTNEDYIFVNSKQYHRIMCRREKRKKLLAQCDKNISKNKKYIHESRHIHAMNRKRGKGGRFLSKSESEKQDEQKDTPCVNINDNNESYNKYKNNEDVEKEDNICYQQQKENINVIQHLNEN